MGRQRRPEHLCSRPAAGACLAFCTRVYKAYAVIILLLHVNTSLAQTGTQRSSRGEYDGRRLVLKVDCAPSTDGSAAADKVASSLPSTVPELEDCTTLPVQCWLLCNVKAPAVKDVQTVAASAADAAAEEESMQLSKVAQTLSELSAYSPVDGSDLLVSTASTTEALQPTAAHGAAATPKSQRRRLFKHVGRNRLMYTAARQLHQVPQSAPLLPSECDSSGCPMLWGMNKIKAPAVWTALADAGLLPLRISKPGMILDTGVDINNRNIKGQVDIRASRTFAAAHARSQASNNGKAGLSSHGSHTFCTVAGAWNEQAVDPSKIAGVLGPASGKMVSCNVFGHNGDEDGAAVSDLVRCLTYAVRAKVHWVINLSLGGYWDRTISAVALLRDALQGVCDAGGIAVVAAQNDGRNVDNPQLQEASFPAAFARELPCVIAVGAIEDKKGVAQLAGFSNWGADVKVVAPGVSIDSCMNTNQGANPWAAGAMSGTSMASPHVAGAALLLVNAFPTANYVQVLDCLLKTATEAVEYANFPDTPGVYVSGGVLDVAAAYRCMEKLQRLNTKPGLSSCSKDTPQYCELAELCTAAQGCSCSSAKGGNCTCNAALGFIAHTSSITGVQRCRWNITMRSNRIFEVPLNGVVKLPVPLPAGFCPAKGVQVVKSVEIGERVSCPGTVQRKLADVSAAGGGAGDPLGESCGQWVMRTDKAGAAAGTCYGVRLRVTDNRSYNLVFRYY